jgi:osmotically inducible lipoprotein OsmB
VRRNIYTYTVTAVITIKEKLMTTTMKRLTAAVLATTLVVALSGCSNWSKRDRNTAIGAGAGAIGGSVLTNGSGLGTVGGAAVGGIIGHQISK